MQDKFSDLILMAGTIREVRGSDINHDTGYPE
jgi:hypothetical protein